VGSLSAGSEGFSTAQCAAHVLETARARFEGTLGPQGARRGEAVVARLGQNEVGLTVWGYRAHDGGRLSC
jgi:hypothetical protein